MVYIGVYNPPILTFDPSTSNWTSKQKFPETTKVYLPVLRSCEGLCSALDGCPGQDGMVKKWWCGIGPNKNRPSISKGLFFETPGSFNDFSPYPDTSMILEKVEFFGFVFLFVCCGFDPMVNHHREKAHHFGRRFLGSLFPNILSNPSFQVSNEKERPKWLFHVVGE